MKLVCEKEKGLLIRNRTGEGQCAIVFGSAGVENGVTLIFGLFTTFKVDVKKSLSALRMSCSEFQLVKKVADWMSSSDIILLFTQDVKYGESENICLLNLLHCVSRLNKAVVDNARVTSLSDHYSSSMAKMKWLRPRNGFSTGCVYECHGSQYAGEICHSWVWWRNVEVWDCSWELAKSERVSKCNTTEKKKRWNSHMLSFTNLLKYFE